MLSLLWIQGAVASVWPSTVKDWVTLCFAVLGPIAALVTWYIRSKLNGMGRRLKVTEDSCAGHGVSVGLLTKHVAGLDHELHDLAREVGVLQGLASRAQERADARMADDHARAVQLERRLTLMEAQIARNGSG